MLVVFIVANVVAVVKRNFNLYSFSLDEYREEEFLNTMKRLINCRSQVHQLNDILCYIKGVNTKAIYVGVLLEKAYEFVEKIFF